MWRLHDYENVAPLAALLDNPDFMTDAAEALNNLNDQNVDNLVLSGLGAGPGNEGRLYFAYLAARDRFIKGEAADLIRQNIDKFSPEAKLYSYMILSFQDKKYLSKAISVYRALAPEKNTSAFIELLRLIGITGCSNGYDFASAAGKRDPRAKAMAVWAMHRIKPVKAIKYDIGDRTIISGQYLKKDSGNPVWPSAPNSLKAWHTANPDILATDSTIYFYYRSGDGTDRISLATVPYNIFNGRNFIDVPNNPIVDVTKKSFDSRACLDPATLRFNNRTFLYYSGLGEGDDMVGLAVAGDYQNFTKQERPVIKGRAPEVVLKDGVIYMFYVLPNAIGGYSIYLATSTDGYDFRQYGKAPVLNYSAPGAWDDKTVTTPRISEKDGVYYMVYAGDNMYRDYPPYFGLAFSYDLIHWTRSTQNPVFSRGKKGQWDDGGIWYGELFLYKGRYHLYYEGWGGGESHENEYGRGGHSQVGMATGSFDVEEML